MSTSLFSQTFRHNGSAVFGTMPPMCRSCPDVNKLRGMDTTILGQHRPFMSIKSFVRHSGWQEMVSQCSLIRLIGVCADRDQPEFLCSPSDSRYLEVRVATAGGWLTRYRPREVRNSIYRYRKIHIDYRSKFLYRFISPISIIYGNTSLNTLRLRQNGRHFADKIFTCICFDETIWIFDLRFDLNLFLRAKCYSIGSDNVLAPNRRQAIIWTNDVLFTDVYMRHSASMS